MDDKQRAELLAKAQRAKANNDMTETTGGAYNFFSCDPAVAIEVLTENAELEAALATRQSEMLIAFSTIKDKETELSVLAAKLERAEAVLRGVAS